MPAPAEFDQQAARPIGRLAIGSPAGRVQNNPANFFVPAGSGPIVIGGGTLGRSKKFQNIRRGRIETWRQRGSA